MAIYTAIFRDDDGSAKTGLSPEVTIIDVQTGTKVVDAVVATELMLGWYYYDFTETDGHQYVCTFDGGVVANMSRRYCDGSSVAKYDSMLTALAASIAALQSDLTSAMALINYILKLDRNTWELRAPNSLLFYDDDQVTVLETYLCYDINGLPTLDDIKRVVRQ